MPGARPAADISWELVEHEIDFGWYAPRIEYVFRADFVADRSITFRQVSGDFKANDGIWEFEPADAGKRTLLRYRVYMDPPGLHPELAGALHLQARAAADAGRRCAVIVRRSRYCAPRPTPTPAEPLSID